MLTISILLFEQATKKAYFVIFCVVDESLYSISKLQLAKNSDKSSPIGLFSSGLLIRGHPKPH